MSRRGAAILVAAVATLVAGRAAAITPAARCAATKELVAGRLVRDLVRCGDPANPDAVCRARASGRFAGEWARAEAPGGCLVTGDATAIGATVDLFLGDLAARLAVAGAPSRCTTQKFVKAASAVLCVLKCEARAGRRGGTVDARCPAACATGFVAACGAAERTNDCRTTADCGPLGGRTQRFAVDVAAALTDAAGLPCPHDVCERGTPMGEPPCNDPCVATICGVDPYCCATTWDATCVAEVASACGLATCPVCGDGFVDFPEVCDPASTPGGCSAGTDVQQRLRALRERVRRWRRRSRRDV